METKNVFYYYVEPIDSQTDKFLADFLKEDSRQKDVLVSENKEKRKAEDLFEVPNIESLKKIYASKTENNLRFKTFRGNLRKEVIPIPFKLLDPETRKRAKTSSVRKRLKEIQSNKSKVVSAI